MWRLRWLSPLAGRGGEGRRPSALQQLLQAQGPAARSPACASDAGYPSALIWCRRLWWEATAVFVEGGGSLNVCARFGSRFCKIRKWLPLLAGRGGEEKVVPVEVLCSPVSRSARQSAENLQLLYFLFTVRQGKGDEGGSMCSWVLDDGCWQGLFLQAFPTSDDKLRGQAQGKELLHLSTRR